MYYISNGASIKFRLRRQGGVALPRPKGEPYE